MMLVVESQDLVPALKRVKLTGSHGGSSAVLMGTHGGRLLCQADNLDIRVALSCPILDGELEGVYFPYDTVYNVLKNYPAGPVRIHFEEHRLYFKSQRKRSSFFVLNPETFPRRQVFGAQEEDSLHIGEHWGAFSRVVGAVHEDENIGGWAANVILRDGYVYATDRYRIHRAPLPNARHHPICLPGRAVTAILKAKCEITDLAWGNNRFQMSSNDMVWEGHLGDPNSVPPTLASFYEPPVVAGFTVDRKDMIRALREIMGLRIDAGTYRDAVALSFDGEWMTIGRAGADIGETSEDLEVTTEGDLHPIGFNAGNLRDTLSLLEGERVTIGSQTDPTRPWRITDSQLEVGIMPVKLNL